MRFRDHPGPDAAAIHDARAVAAMLRYDAEQVFSGEMGMRLDMPLRNGLVPEGRLLDEQSSQNGRVNV